MSTAKRHVLQLTMSDPEWARSEAMVEMSESSDRADLVRWLLHSEIERCGLRATSKPQVATDTEGSPFHRLQVLVDEDTYKKAQHVAAYRGLRNGVAGLLSVLLEEYSDEVGLEKVDLAMPGSRLPKRVAKKRKRVASTK